MTPPAQQPPPAASRSAQPPSRPAQSGQQPGPTKKKKGPPAPEPITAEVMTREKRIALRRNAVREQVAETVRAIVLQLGPEAVALGEVELAARNLVAPKSKREGAPRRYTTYLPEALGAKLNAHAKAETVSPQVIVVRALERYLSGE